MLGALEAADQPATLSTVADLLFPKALEAFARKIPDEDRAQRLYAYIDSLDRSALSAVVGLGSRLATLIESEAGPWLQDGDDADAATPSVDLLEALTSGEPVLFSLDALRFPGLAAQMGALLLQDLKAVAAELLARGNARPCYLVIDEFNIFEGRQVLALLNKGREAGLCCVLATQDLADVDAAGGPTLVDQVLANTNVKLLLRQEVDAYANRLAMAVGTRTAWLGTHRSSNGLPTGEASMREVDEFIVHPNLLKQLPPHQAVLVRKAPELVAQQLRLWAAEGCSPGHPGAALRALSPAHHPVSRPCRARPP